MTFNMITENHDYNPDGYIGLVNLQLQNIPDEIEIDRVKLYVKSEFHISITKARYLAELIDPTNAEQAEAQLVQDFLAYVADHNVLTFSLTQEFYFVTKDDRKTLVVLCDMPAIDAFFDHLEEKYGKTLPHQVAHITLYASQYDRGIGIMSQEHLQQMAKRVDVPELKNIAVA